jgi:heme oxygenase (biliverdin-IX-beta and delta-forming)
MTDTDDNADRYRTPTDSIIVEAGEFLGAFRTLLMATVSTDGVPDASYAPFVRVDDNAFYVNLSALSTHTGNLLATPLVSVMFLQAEDDSKQLFARKRLGFDADAELVARDSARWCQVLDLFSDKFGDIIDLIRPLQDFKLFRIQPRSGVYVRGFAQAYPLEGPGLEQLRQVNDL